jgi:predicted nucleotidyltransferase
MTRISEIKKYAGSLAREFHPNRVILFGSYARGKPTEDSDVDILVIMNLEQAIAIDRRVDYSFPLDLLVRKPAEVKRRMALRDAFILAVLKEGKVLYERRS